MKHITLFALAIALVLHAPAQVIFQSGFESWTGNIPDDWFGMRTSIAASAVSQATANVHGGTYAVHLENTLTGTSDHKRFSTQDLTVTNGQGYTVTFWVRGQGDVRLGLYDGRTGNGYAPYTPYTTISDDNTWQQVSLQVAAAMDATDAQFILSVKSTVAPEHLVLDDVTIEASTIDPPTAATIQEIQETTDPGGVSPLNGTTVVTEGVISAIVPGASPGFFMQDGTGPWTGLYVFTATTGLNIGDRVGVTGIVTEFNGQTQLATVTNVQAISTGQTLTPTAITTAEGNTEPYESVLVIVQNASCTASGPFGQYTVNDGSGNVLVDDVTYAHPFMVGSDYNITGALQYAFSEWRILPRSAADVTLVTGIEENVFGGVSLFPNPASDAIILTVGSTEPSTELMLHDALGRVVFNSTLRSDRTSFPVNDLANGTYVLTLRKGSAVWSDRIVVAH